MYMDYCLTYDITGFAGPLSGLQCLSYLATVVTSCSLSPCLRREEKKDEEGPKSCLLSHLRARGHNPDQASSACPHSSGPGGYPGWKGPSQPAQSAREANGCAHPLAMICCSLASKKYMTSEENLPSAFSRTQIHAAGPAVAGSDHLQAQKPRCGRLHLQSQNTRVWRDIFDHLKTDLAE